MNWFSKIKGKRIQFRQQKGHVEILQELSSPSYFDSSLEKYYMYETVNVCQDFIFASMLSTLYALKIVLFYVAKSVYI